MVFECRYLHFQKMRFRGTFRFIFIYASFRNSVTLRFADYTNAMLEIMSAEIGAKVTQRAPKRWSYATMERVESVGK